MRCPTHPLIPPTCSCGVGTIIRTEEALERLRLMRTSCRAGRGGGRGKSGPHAQVWEGRGDSIPSVRKGWNGKIYRSKPEGVEGADL